MKVYIKRRRSAFMEIFNRITAAAILATVIIVCLEAVWWICNYYN